MEFQMIVTIIPLHLLSLEIFVYCLVHIDIQAIYSVNFIFAQSFNVDIGLDEKIRLVHQIFSSVQTNI